mmetsp:Transcript_11807/g.32176  ORF Transcript_11807/g.32176 Transcript_11807/m.32176 type:complete len:219 (-) Transcript_11807:157-813(-)
MAVFELVLALFHILKHILVVGFAVAHSHKALECKWDAFNDPHGRPTPEARLQQLTLQQSCPGHLPALLSSHPLLSSWLLFPAHHQLMLHRPRIQHRLLKCWPRAMRRHPRWQQGVARPLSHTCWALLLRGRAVGSPHPHVNPAARWKRRRIEAAADESHKSSGSHSARHLWWMRGAADQHAGATTPAAACAAPAPALGQAPPLAAALLGSGHAPHAPA